MPGGTFGLDLPSSRQLSQLKLAKMLAVPPPGAGEGRNCGVEWGLVAVRTSGKGCAMRSVKMSGAHGMLVSSWKHRAMMLLLAMVAGGSLLAGLAVGPPASAAAAPPRPAPGVTMSAAARSASTVYLAYTATNQAVYVRNAAQPGQAAIALGGRLIGGPAAVVVPAGVLSPGAVLAVFGRGTNNALWWRHQTASGWSSWQSLGGILTSAPGAAADMTDQFGALNVFVRGTNGVIWYRVFGSGKWGPWTSLGGAVMAGTGPGAGDGLFAIANPDRHVSVFGRIGMNNGYTDFGGLTTATPGITRTVPRGRGLRAWPGQCALVPAGHAAGRAHWPMDVARRTADLRRDGNNCARREDICFRARHRQQHLDEDGHLAVPRRLDAAVTANRTTGPGQLSPGPPYGRYPRARPMAGHCG